MTPREVAVRVVDSFTTTPFAGNPAGVVLEAEGLSEAAMQAVARELNASETAFLLGATRPDADLRLRWFSPTTEVDLCGHATVATFHAAMEQGKLAPGTFRMECKVGVLPVTLERGAGGRPEVGLGLPVPRLSELPAAPAAPAAPEAVAAALGIAQADLDAGQPMARTGEWLLVPVRGLEVLRRMRPDFGAIRAVCADSGTRSWIVLTTQTLEPESAVHLRMLAPAFGIDEDPVTGSAQGPVAAWLVTRGLLPRGAGSGPRYHYTAEQGDIIGRPGRIQVSVDLEEQPESSGIARITITGRAVTVMRGAITLEA